ncbi:hypothetical protein [Priestia megaterium]|uniref:hypothetical protein n=1 Tax=Priestia megaterium TaxID=1404 RepID=UPI000BF68FD8|nr:hypothetical protein [Priestia megaterium]PFR96962.1 hypothetical protein COK39_06470 [Priestia megaterium]
MLKMTSKGFAQIPNVAFGFRTDYKLNKDDLKVFAYLQFAKQVGTMIVRTNVEIIVEDLGWETTKTSRDKTRVANALNNLSEKGYIEIVYKKDIKKDSLTITINEHMKNVEAQSKVEWKQNPFNFKKFTQIGADEYNLAENNDYALLVVAFYKWRNNDKFKYAICDKEWAEVLELSVKRTRAIIDECTFLTKISGAKYQDENGQWKQEANQYVMEKDIKVSEKLEKADAETKKMSFLEKQREKVTDLLVKLDNDTFNQIFDKKTPIELDGYRAWKETECKIVREAGQSKIDAILKSPKEGAKYVVKRLEKEYQEYLSHQASQRQLERFADKQLEEMNANPEAYMTEEEWEKEQAQKRAKRRAKDKNYDFFDDM